jgi:superfamily II DNA/RNA helicase
MLTFDEMLLSKELKTAISDLKFETPTKIQSAVIPVALKGHDVIACAETGSGKTAAFGISVLKNLSAAPDKRALILAPTRELVHQISDFMRSLAANNKEIRVASIVGGSDMKRQFKALQRRPKIIVATPGRLNDHLRRGSIKLNKAEFLVLDEGDRMLDMGFAPQLDEILKYLPNKRQTMLFTATLSNKVKKLAESYQRNPQSINIGTPSQPVSSIKQRVVQVSQHDKRDQILDEINKTKGSVIIFTRTKRRTDELAEHLSEYGLKVDVIHGGRSQGQRNQAIRSFKNGKTRILVATDVASRGIDIPQVEHVINFDIPTMDEDYVHRIGRTARNGADGEAVTFVTPHEHKTWKVLAKKYKIKGVELQEERLEKIKKFYKGNKKRSFKNSKSSKGQKRSEDSNRSSRSEKSESKKRTSRKKTSSSNKTRKSSRDSARMTERRSKSKKRSEDSNRSPRSEKSESKKRTSNKKTSSSNKTRRSSRDSARKTERNSKRKTDRKPSRSSARKSEGSKRSRRPKSNKSSRKRAK